MKRQFPLGASVATLALVLAGSTLPSVAATQHSTYQNQQVAYRLTKSPRDSVYASQRRLDPPTPATKRLQNESWSNFLKRDQQWDSVGPKDITHFGVRQNRMFERGDPGIRTDAGVHTF